MLNNAGTSQTSRGRFSDDGSDWGGSQFLVSGSAINEAMAVVQCGPNDLAQNLTRRMYGARMKLIPQVNAFPSVLMRTHTDCMS